MSNTDYKKEWFLKAQVDYFSSFINLWLSCNSWYNFQYSLDNDRQHIDKIKTDFENHNKLFIAFKKLFDEEPPKEQKNLFSNIELLHYSLSRKTLTPKKLKQSLSFENVIIKDAKTKTGKLKKAFENAKDLGDIVIDGDKKKVFAELFEIIYQVRCMLVHGEIEPKENSHEIVKYCYLILFDLMKSFCG